MIRIGSLFSGIGGFELGVERAIPNSKTVWQVEQNKHCQTVLKKQWPDAKIYDDVCLVEADKVEPVEILLGGFPCQDISIAGKQRGVHNGKKSSLWWQMHRIIRTIRPRIVIMENVANIVRVGGTTVVASLAEIGYCTEWTIIRASDFGAPHRRARWFGVAYTYSDGSEEQHVPELLDPSSRPGCRDSKNGGIQPRDNYWQTTAHPSPLCRVDDGISNRVARLKALGNSIVPQCSEWVALQVLNSGLIDDLL